MRTRIARPTAVPVECGIRRLMMDGRLIVHIPRMMHRSRIADSVRLSGIGVMNTWGKRGSCVRTRDVHGHVRPHGMNRNVDCNPRNVDGAATHVATETMAART